MGDATVPPRRHPLLRRWGTYALGALVVLGLLALVATQASRLPAACFGLVWAALSALSMLGVTHAYLMRKLRRQAEFEPGGVAARVNGGRMGCLVLSFLASAVATAGLLLGVPTWGAVEWALVGASVLAFALVSCAFDRLLRREVRPAFRAARAQRASVAVTSALLLAGFVAAYVLTPAPQAVSAAEAFLAAPQPFAGSPSAILADAGMVQAFADALSAFGMSQAAGVSTGAYVAWRAVSCVLATTSLVSLLAACSLGAAELRRVFLPLGAAPAPAGGRATDGAPASAGAPAPGEQLAPAGAPTPDAPARPRAVRRYVVAACVLPALLAAAFPAADAWLARAEQGQEVTAAEAFVRRQADLAVFVLDGAYYQYQGVQDLLAQASEQSEQLAADARAALVPVADAFYDACLDNVDGYLDWYYSLPADYEQLLHLVTGTAEDFVASQLVTHLEEGADDVGLTDALEQYQRQASELQDSFDAQLEGLRLSADVPDWLPARREELDPDALSKALDPTMRLSDGAVRLAAGGVAGVAGGIGAKVIVKNAVDKGFFKKLVEKVVAKLGSKAASSGVGTVVGAALGSAAPGVGTAVGAVAGAAVGVAVGTGVDFGLLKLDEWQHRDAYRQEIVDGIEQARADTLAMLDGGAGEAEDAGESGAAGEAGDAGEPGGAGATAPEPTAAGGEPDAAAGGQPTEPDAPAA